jgi:class 3 adenylate cyclase
LFRGAVTSTTYVAFAEAARKTVLTDALERLTVDTLVLVDSSPSSHPDLGRAVAARIRGARFAITDEYGRDLLLFLGLRPYERPAPAPAAAPSSTAVILFADIVESTAMTERIGNAAFRERSTALETRIRAAVQSHGGSAVAGRTLGDGVLATFTSASEGIAAALECAGAGGDLGLALHLGLHAGDVLREDGNVHGIAVSLASRVSALAEPNEVLVSQTVRDLARASAGVTFEDRGEHALKGIADPVRVYAVRES